MTIHLPAESTPFIGRATELTEIGERLASPACRLLTVLGPGGIGKTRLAIQAARGQIDNFAHGIYFVSLAPAGSADSLASAIASALDISFYGSESTDVQPVNYLRETDLLLVLDNFEHLLAGTPCYLTF
ncbi:MAG: hypothetical protein ACYDBJ_29175 [Aggregatilineales bacterium]